MNRGWIDRSVKRVPTYKEITSTSITDKGKGRQIDEEDSDSHTGDEEAERRIEDADVDEDDFDEEESNSHVDIRTTTFGEDPVKAVRRRLEQEPGESSREV